MSETALAPAAEQAAILEAVVVGGNLADLSPAQRLDYYRARCRSAGLDPLAQPFQYITLQNRLTLYATKAATDQLAGSRGLNVEILSRDVTEGDIYEVVCRVRDGQRVTEDIGAVYVGGVKGEALANARKKAVTQAKRRAILAHCGLGMLDETEVADIPGAVEVAGEIPAAQPVEPPVKDKNYWRRYAFALYAELGGDTDDRPAMRADMAKDLGTAVQPRSQFTAEEWERWALHLEGQRQRGDFTQALQEGERSGFAQQMGL